MGGMARFGRLLPLLLMELSVGIVGFALSVGWTYRVNKTSDPDTVRFLMKMWIGLTAAFLIAAASFSN